MRKTWEGYCDPKTLADCTGWAKFCGLFQSPVSRMLLYSCEGIRLCSRIEWLPMLARYAPDAGRAEYCAMKSGSA